MGLPINISQLNGKYERINMIDELGFGQRLEQAMIKSGYSNARLTKELNLSKNAIGNYKNNQIPNTITLFEISQRLGISMEYLLTGEENHRELSEDELELLKYFRMLPQKIKDREIGRLEDRAEQYSTGKSSDSMIG